MAVVESLYVPRAHALSFHARAQRFAIMVLHRRAGKTVCCVGDLVDKAMQNGRQFPPPMYGYIAPLYKQAKRSAWKYLKHYTQGIAVKVMESELSVVLANGAQIRLFGADNPDSIRGDYFDGVILDEYGDMSPRLYPEVVLPMLADYKGWCVFIGTPKGANHFRDLWRQVEATGNKWYRKMLRASESGIIDAEELEMIRTSPAMDEATFLQEMECSFEAANKGAYYGAQLMELEKGGHFGDFPYDPDYEVLTAWDIGYSDDTSVWFYQTNGKELKIIDFFTASGLSVDEVLGRLRGKPYAYGTFYLPHDARNKSFQTGKSTRELMIAAGCNTRLVPRLSIQDGIQAVRATLPQCWFNSTNPDVQLGVSALQTYQREYDDKRQMYRESPLHNWASNPADAFRMLALAMNPTAVKAAGQVIRTAAPTTPESNVLHLENLFADRAAQNSGAYRRI